MRVAIGRAPWRTLAPCKSQAAAWLDRSWTDDHRGITGRPSHRLDGTHARRGLSRRASYRNERTPLRDEVARLLLGFGSGRVWIAHRRCSTPQWTLQEPSEKVKGQNAPKNIQGGNRPLDHAVRPAKKRLSVSPKKDAQVRHRQRQKLKYPWPAVSARRRETPDRNSQEDGGEDTPGWRPFCHLSPFSR